MSLKDTQDSVTSYTQMNNILKVGTYHVESKPSAKTISDVISVELKTKSKRIPKRNYTFEELEDLDGRLVLITGSMAENREQVDKFRNVRPTNFVCNNLLPYNIDTTIYYMVLNTSILSVLCPYWSSQTTSNSASSPGHSQLFNVAR